MSGLFCLKGECVVATGLNNKSKRVASKLCIRCNRVLPLAKFYPNKSWLSQSYHDVWCKDCAAKYCYDEETIRQYCYENNRKWEDSFYDSAMKKAQYTQANNAEYLDPKTSSRKCDEIAGRTAARQFFSMMNIGGFYEYVENIGDDGVYIPDQRENTNSLQTSSNNSENNEKAKLIYSRKWRGNFTQEQIETLEDIYAQYEEDFVLDNVNIRDYACKVAKASLNADIAEDRMRRGEIPPSDYKEAQKIFDDLSKSSNFAACRRKPGESSGLGSLGEIILRLEVGGSQNTQGFTFPEDDVDKIICDFRHTLVAVGLEGRL